MGNWEPIWIASLATPPWIERKIHMKHGIDIEEVRRNLLCNPLVLGRVTRSRDHGSRTVVFSEYAVEKYIIAHIDLVDEYYSAWSLRTVRIASQIPIVRR